MIRKKKKQKTIQQSQPIIRNWGGCIPHIDSSCLKSHMIFEDGGILWIDSGVCHDCSDKPCKFHKEWERIRNGE